MAIDSDNQLSLPDPPPPRPAARKEAIDAALRKFDGIEETPAVTPSVVAWHGSAGDWRACDRSDCRSHQRTDCARCASRPPAAAAAASSAAGRRGCRRACAGSSRHPTTCSIRTGGGPGQQCRGSRRGSRLRSSRRKRRQVEAKRERIGLVANELKARRRSTAPRASLSRRPRLHRRHRLHRLLRRRAKPAICGQFSGSGDRRHRLAHCAAEPRTCCAP